MDQFRRQDPKFPWDRVIRVAPLAIVAMVVLLLLWNSFYTVAPHERAVVLRFGKFLGVADPGLHFKLPLVNEILKVSVAEHSLRLPFGPRGSGGSVHEDETLMLTGDLNTAAVEWTVQWKVTDPAEFLFRFPHHDDSDEQEEEVDEVIATVARTVMNRLIGDYSIDEVLTDQRSAIAHLAREATQGILTEYHCGITIPALQMQRVTPPDKVKPSFDRVVGSVQQRDKLASEAEKVRNTKMPAAYAEKDKLIRSAEGYANQRRAEANGEISALLARYRAYEKAPQITRQRMYLEAMQDVLSAVKDKTIVDADLDQLFPLLSLPENTR